jgi:hypothetical protein
MSGRDAPRAKRVACASAQCRTVVTLLTAGHAVFWLADQSSAAAAMPWVREQA